MSIKSKNKRAKICLMVVTTCLALAGFWAVLATPETALARRPEVLHGSASFRDGPGDRVRSDGEGPYTYTGSGKGDAILLGLGDFFRLRVKVDKKGVGRRFDLDFGGLDIDPTFFPASENIWILWIKGTLAEWRAQETDDPVLREGKLHFGQTGKDEANVSYGRWDESSYLTVTRTGTGVWTIESLDDNEAVFYRQDVGMRSGPMPFLVTYNGQ